jgi:hypothetical protein
MLLLGCDAEELLIPNDEMKPSEVVKVSPEKLLVTATSGLVTIKLDEDSKLILWDLLAETRRVKIPTGVHGELVIDIKTEVHGDSVTLAQFSFDEDRPLISNDGREYAVLKGAKYRDFIGSVHRIGDTERNGGSGDEEAR